MPTPKAPEVVLRESERAELERLVRAHTTGQQLATRARLVLLAAEGLTNTQLSVALGLDFNTVSQWRQRWVQAREVPLEELSVAERLADAPRTGAPARITPEQVCQIIALACEQPADSDRPISHWSQRELADEIMRRGIVAYISARHAGRLLKSSGPQTPPEPLLAHPLHDRARRPARGADRRRV